MPEAHKRPGVIADFILGSQDGIVNVLGVILGVALGTATFAVARARGRTPSDGGVRAALQRAATRYRGVPPTVRLYTRIKYFADPGYLRTHR